MRIAAVIAACMVVTASAATAGAQSSRVVVKPRVPVHIDTGHREPPPEELRSFGVTLVINFWVEEPGANAGEPAKKVLAVELRCATPEYGAALAKDTGEFEHRFEIHGVIVLLRDRDILLVFETEIASGGQGRSSAVEIRGSAILHEGEKKLLLSTGDKALYASFAFDVER